MSQANGVVMNLPRSKYELVQRVNWSSLKVVGRSPAHYRHELLRQGADTAARKLGRACHLAALEPERYRHEVAVWTEGRRAGKKWEAFCSEHEGQELLKEDEAELCQAIQRAVRNDSAAAKYLAGGQGEVSLFWTHVTPPMGALPGYSLDCKGRVDFLATDRALVDLKTTRDASEDGFGREVYKYRYHAQAAFYADGYAAATGIRLPYVVVAVESAPPHVVQVYRVPDRVLDAGRELYRALLDRLHICREHATWPGYFDGEAELSLPKWAAGGADDDDPTGLGLDFSNAAQPEHA